MKLSEKLLKELREKIARFKELRGKDSLTDEEKEERGVLPDIIEGLNADYAEEVRAEKLLDGLDISFEAPPGGDNPEGRGGATMVDKPIYRNLGEQVQDIIVTGGGAIPGVSASEARRRIDENDKRSIEIMGAPAAELRSDAQSVKDSASGGGLVQTEFAYEMVEKGFNNGIVAQKCTQRDLSAGANSIDMFGLDEDSRATGFRYGGIQVFTKREMEKYEPSKAKFAKITMKVDKLTGLLKLSDEIMQNAAFLEGEIGGLFPKAFGFKVQDLVFSGRGAGEMLGVHNSKAMLTIPKEDSQAAKTIVAENISKMKAAAAGNAEFYGNRDIIPELDGLYREYGDKAVPLFKQTSINEGVLDGVPVTFVEQAETLGALGDLLLADFEEYVILRQGGVKQAESLHFMFDQALKCIRWDLYLDGQSRWKSPLSPYKGTNKISPFVRLAARV